MHTDVLVTAPDFGGPNGIAPFYLFYNGGVHIDHNFFFIGANPGTNFETDIKQAILTSMASYATANGYIVDSVTWWFPDNATATVSGLMSSADKVKLNSLSSGAFKSFQSIVSQTGTSAPTGSNLVSDFGSTTFTWARTGAGVYTLTANSAVFTSGKTAVLITDPSNALWAFRPVVTSTTVITLTTSVLAILAVVLGATNTDALLSNNLVEVRVFP